MKTHPFRTLVAFPSLTLLLALPAQAQPGSAGGAIHFFNGRGGNVRVLGYGNVAPTNEITIEFWQRTGLIQQQSSLSLYPNVDSNRINIHLPFADGKVYWDFGNSGGAGRLSYTLPVTALASWQHFAFVASQSGNYMAIYRNGVQEAVKPGMTPFAPYNSDLVLGAFLDGPFYFAGDLDEVRIWNVARSQGAIQSTMHQTLVGNEAGLVAYWRFDEGSGGTTADATGKGNTGNIYSGAAWTLSTAPISTPVVVPSGANPMTNECLLAGFISDPGAVATASPLNLGVGYNDSEVAKADGSAVVWGDNTYGQTNVPAGTTNVFALASGGGHLLALRVDGTVLAWGYNGNGQTNVPSYAVGVVAISAGRGHSLALRADGSVIGWGDNTAGQLNIPAGLNDAVAIAAGNDFSLALKSDGRVVGWGANNNIFTAPVTNPPPTVNNVVAIAAGGEDFALALRADGTVVAWGYNTDGQTNVPPGAINVVGISAGLLHSLALKTDGTVVAWGDNLFGQLNAPPSLTNVVGIGAGSGHCVGLKANGTIVSWGSSQYGLQNIPPNLNTFAASAQNVLGASPPGTGFFTYGFTNLFGTRGSATRTVVVEDTTPPTVTLAGPNLLSLTVGTPFTDPGASAYDVCAGDITGTIAVLGAVNPNRAGSYNLTYAAVDPSGNFGFTNRVVWVTPTQPQPIGCSISLNSEANPGGCDTLAYFQYGLTSSYGALTPSQDLGSGSSPVPFSATLTNLLPGTTYHYRVVTSNCNGISYGPDMAFTTSPYLVPGDLNGDGIVDQNELNIVLTNYWPYSPWLLMTNTFGLSTTNILFSLTNANNFDLSVQVTTNFLHWDYLGVAHQRYQFFDPFATNAPARYYRLRWP
ncbi:MAG: hypothetical protein C5B50_15205 [Verrucomicrobia bacterium]|nr:MAG: hypothetical protein C5B50_15205 [Verrucomicrobiota bacterium]